MRIKVKKEVAEFLENAASAVKINNNEYFYMPFWFKRTIDPTVFEQLSWDSLPKDLQNFIQSRREGEKP